MFLKCNFYHCGRIIFITFINAGDDEICIYQEHFI